jgi:hypothetical protein
MKPFQTNEERLVDEALAAALILPADMIRRTRSQPVLVPPKYGYPTAQPTISDVLSLRRPPTRPYNVNYTGGAGEINATARNTGTGWI